IITDIDLAAALGMHKDSGALATMVLKENPNHEKFTIINTDGGFVTGFGGFPEPIFPDELRTPHSALRAPLMYTGIQILEPAVFDYIPPDVESDIISVFYRPVMAHGKRIAAHVADGNWRELSTIQRYLDISLAVSNSENNGVSVGRNADIALSASLRDSILWDDVTIEPGAIVERAFLGDGIRISAGETIKNAAVVRADLVRNAEIPPKALPGRFEGENYVVPLG
ncbi:MAG TPA: NDP-sugar synthase, partial [Pyrinomonadaceae bacterium]|nr:NDP-sugar synthase [Pyrinomonadaceae bacterium]